MTRPYCLRDGDKRVAETCDFLNSKSTVVHPEIDPKDPYKPAHTGIFVRAVTAPKKVRNVIYYVPEHYPASGEAAFLFPDDGETSAGFLETHAEWKELSEERHVLLAILEPVDGRWRPQSIQDEVDCVNAVVNSLHMKELFSVNESTQYCVGLGTGAYIAAAYSLQIPRSLRRLSLKGDLNCTQT